MSARIATRLSLATIWRTSLAGKVLHNDPRWKDADPSPAARLLAHSTAKILLQTFLPARIGAASTYRPVNQERNRIQDPLQIGVKNCKEVYRRM